MYATSALNVENKHVIKINDPAESIKWIVYAIELYVKLWNTKWCASATHAFENALCLLHKARTMPTDPDISISQ